MNFINHPAVQSSIIPFTTSLLLLLVLFRWPRFNGLAVMAGLLASVYFIMGFDIQPLTSTKKLLLSTLGFYGFGEIMMSLRSRFKDMYWRFILLILTSAAYIWILWPVLSQHSTTAAAIIISIGLIFIIATLGLLLNLPKKAELHAMGALIFAVVSGFTIVLSGSALYGQILFALAAALGAVVLFSYFRPNSNFLSMSIASIFLIVLTNLAAIQYAQMNTWLLLPLAICMMPLLMLQNRSYTHWQWLIFTLLCSLPGAVASVSLAWYISGPPPF